MQAKTLNERLEEASMLLDAILDCFGDREDDRLTDAETFLDEEYYQKIQKGKK